MKAAGAIMLETMLKDAGEQGDAMAEIGSLAMSEVAQSMIAVADLFCMRRNGTRLPPETLRMLADEAEALAREYRAVAERREREAS